MTDKKELFNTQASAMIYDITITPDNKTCLASLESGEIEVYSLENYELIKTLKGHRNPVGYIAITFDRKYIVSASNSETVVWDINTLESIVTIEEKISLCFSSHRLLIGILHEGLYKHFSTKLLREFSDEVPEEKEQVTKSSKSKSKELTIAGPMNSIFPKILDEMMSKGKNAQSWFIPALIRNTIQPYRCNINHFMAYQNNPSSL
jgi:WD40 repeat protein